MQLSNMVVSTDDAGTILEEEGEREVEREGRREGRR